MEKGHVLVLGCSDTSTKAGLNADEKAIVAQNCLVTVVSTGSAVRDGEGVVEVVGSTPETLQNQMADHMQSTDIKVVKIGAIFSAECIQVVSSILKRHPQLQSLIDTEPFFKTGPAPNPDLVKALIKDILPSMTLLSATVPEVKALLDEAGIAAEYPKNMEDVVQMAKTTQSLGPKHVIIKREIFDEGSKTTTLHFVLAGEGEEPVIKSARFENPKGVAGTSYSIPPIISANLAKGKDVPQAISEAFQTVEELIKGGSYFD